MLSKRNNNSPDLVSDRMLWKRFGCSPIVNNAVDGDEDDEFGLAIDCEWMDGFFSCDEDPLLLLPVRVSARE